MKKIVLFVFLAIVAAGCATRQEAHLPQPYQSNGAIDLTPSGQTGGTLYRSRHTGILPGPDNAVSAAVARTLLEQGMAEAEVTRERAAMMAAYREDPEKFREPAQKLGVVSSPGRYAVAFWNQTPHLLKVGVTGDTQMKTVPPGGHTEFFVQDKTYSVYTYRISQRGETPFRDKQFRIHTPTPEIPFRGKIFASQVIMH